jgi:hypothetical protein
VITIPQMSSERSRYSGRFWQISQTWQILRQVWHGLASVSDENPHAQSNAFDAGDQ